MKYFKQKREDLIKIIMGGLYDGEVESDDNYRKFLETLSISHLEKLADHAIPAE